MAKLPTNPLNEEHDIVGADHSNIVFDYPYVTQMFQKALNFCNKLVEKKAQKSSTVWVVNFQFSHKNLADY